MAQGRHLFPYRTQKLSLAAVTILGVHPWENSTVPNYRIKSPNRTLFLLAACYFLDAESTGVPVESIDGVLSRCRIIQQTALIGRFLFTLIIFFLKEFL